MNLAEIRDLFVKRCGRYDLVKEDGSDDGANFFIQSGSRFLDRQSDLRRTREGISVVTTDGQGQVKLKDCWLVRDVFLLEGSTWRPLTRIASSMAIQSKFAHTSSPIFYAVPLERYSPELRHLSADMVKAPSSAFTQANVDVASLSLEILPRPSREYTLEVHGNFYSPALDTDTSSNIWSEMYPETLLKASLYELEVFYRNTEGANDWLSAIQADLIAAEQLEVFEEIHNKDEMGL